MAWSVPIAGDLFGLNPQIAAGVRVPDVSAGFDAYFAGQEQAQKQALQSLFKGGLPRDAAGNIDYNQVAEQLARISGAGAIPTLTSLRQADIQQQALRGLEGGAGGIFGPVTPQQPRESLPPSIQRTAPTPIEPSGERLRSGQQGNLGEVIGVDYGPTQTSFADRFAGEPQAAAAPGYPRQFSEAPVTGPSTERFAQAAQAQGAPSATRPPPPPPPTQALVPPGSPGFFSEENAAGYEAAANRANYVATILGAAQMAPAAAGPKQQAEQFAGTAKLIREALAKREEKTLESQLKVGAAMPEAAAKASVTRLEKGQEKAEGLSQGAAVTQDLFDQLNSRSGIFSGAWANEKLKLARIAAAMGYPNPEEITNTQTFTSLMGKRVAAGVKAFGSGTSITNQDREYVNKMEGGDITLDETSIRRLLDINDKIGRETIKKHNADLDRVIKSQPTAQGQLEPFRVEMPPPIQGRKQEPKPGPSGSTWTSSKGNTYRLNPDGSLGPLIPRQ